MSQAPRIVIVCSDGDSTRAIAAALEERFGPITIVMEKPVSKWLMAKRRLQRLGLLTTIGQLAFIVAVTPVLRRMAARRIAEIEEQHGLEKEFMSPIINVDSINSDEAIDAVKHATPDVVVVSGTRIIAKKLLQAVSAPFINMHAGITPLYRGVHGGYWALFEGRPELVGTTVHLVDAGIDTGNIIEQSHFSVIESDNFSTYPYLHTAAGIPALIRAVEKVIEDALKPSIENNGLGSQLRYHPTIWQYLYGRTRRGIR